jgi:hypothetical protein
VVAVVVELLDIVVPADEALAPVLVGAAAELELLEAGEDPPHAASSRVVSTSASATRAAIAPA